MNSKLKGKVHKYERDNIDTDVIIPGPYLKIHDHKELAKHAMEGIDPKFPEKVSQGDFLVTGSNFGCGSSREHALDVVGVMHLLPAPALHLFQRRAGVIEPAPAVPVDPTLSVGHPREL